MRALGSSAGALVALCSAWWGSPSGAAPSLDEFAVVTDTVDVTTSGEEVTFELSMASPAGFFDGVATFVSPGGSEYAVPFGADALVGGDGTVGDYRVTFEFPRFAEPGQWRVNLQLQDLAGAVSDFGAAGSAFPAGADLTLAVANGGHVDSAGPELLGWLAPDGSVVLSNSAAINLDFTVVPADDGVGFWAAFLRVYADSGQWVAGSAVEPDLYDRGSDSGYSIGVTLPPGLPAGPLTFLLTLEDHFGHRRTYSSSRFATGNELRLFPPWADAVVAGVPDGIAGDGVPPDIVDAQLSQPAVDVTGKQRQVTLTIGFVDLADVPAQPSGVKDARYTLVSPEGGFLDIPSSFQLVSGTRHSGTLMGTLSIPPYSSPGNWTGFIEVWDWNGNNRIYGVGGASVPPDEGWELNLAVDNHGPVDTRPPELFSAAFDRPSVDISSSDETVSFILELGDDATGLEEASVIILGDGDPALHYEILLTPEDRSSGGITRAVYRGSFVVPQFSSAQQIELRRATLIDGAGNAIVYSAAGSGEPLPPGAAQQIAVRNNGAVDLSAPVLATLTLSATAADVSAAGVQLNARFEIADDASGFAEGTLFLGPYSWPIRGSARTSGTATAGEYSVAIELAQFAQPGEHPLSVVLADLTGKVSVYGDEFGVPLPAGAPAFVEIINTAGTDDTAPELLALTLSPESIDVALGGEVMLAVAARDTGAGGISGTLRVAGVEVDFGAADLVAGDGSDGVFAVSLALPADLAAGEYGSVVELQDALGNSRRHGGGYDPFPAGSAESVAVLNSRPVGSTGIEVVEFFPLADKPALAFKAVRGVVYSLLSNTDFSSEWEVVAGSIEGNGGEITLLDREDIAASPRRFYRIVADGDL